jgi:D-alanyl-D-alanine carboxypeptidase/D-alanyl-D-alanine-endopeptidase (penicillin-binding protein 4)
MKQVIILILLLISGVFELTGQTNSVQSKINSIKNDNYMKNASISFIALNAETGEEIAQYRSKRSLVPASIMKLFTTSTAFQKLGAAHRIKTELYHDGTIDTNGVLHGNIYIKGHGDPSLGSRFFTKKEEELAFLKVWTDSIKAFGIKSIDGAIIADASYFSYDGVPSGWSWGDMGNYYGSGPSGLTIFDNMCYLEFRTGAKKGDSTILECIRPHIPYMTMKNHVLSADSKKDNAYVYGAPYSNDRFVTGSIPKNKDKFMVKASVPDAEFFFAYLFMNALEDHGVDMKYRPITMRELDLNKDEKKALDLKKIKTFKGQKLYKIICWVNQESVNLFAESLLCYIGAKRSGQGSTWNGAAAVKAYWSARNDLTGFYMTDGSGLSRSNAVSAKHFADMLKYMYKQKTFESFKNSLAQTGKRGTIRSMCRGGAGSGRVYAKSGSMNRIRSYAGYVYSSSGKKIAFAIIFNNFNCTSTQVKRMCEGLFNTMAAY